MRKSVPGGSIESMTAPSTVSTSSRIGEALNSVAARASLCADRDYSCVSQFQPSPSCPEGRPSRRKKLTAYRIAWKNTGQP